MDNKILDEKNTIETILDEKEFSILSKDDLQILFRDEKFSKNIPEFFPKFPINKFEIANISSLHIEFNNNYTYIYKNIKIISNYKLNFDIYKKQKYDTIVYYDLDDDFIYLYENSKLYTGIKTVNKSIIINKWNDSLLSNYEYIIRTDITGCVNNKNIILSGDIFDKLKEKFKLKINKKKYKPLGYTNKNGEDHYTTIYICWNS